MRAASLTLGADVTPANEDERHVQQLIDDLEDELLVEEDVHLPLSVDGEDVTISGIVDLVHITPTQIEIVDYKTDRGRHAESEYRKQLSVYFHVATSQYPDREVSATIFYTDDGTRRRIDPLSLRDLKNLIREIDSTSQLTSAITNSNSKSRASLTTIWMSFG